MKMIAKVKLSSKMTTGTDAVRLAFYADYSDGRNKEWAVATPSLSIDMTVKPEVAERLTAGQAYTLTFEENNE